MMINITDKEKILEEINVLMLDMFTLEDNYGTKNIEIKLLSDCSIYIKTYTEFGDIIVVVGFKEGGGKQGLLYYNMIPKDVYDVENKDILNDRSECIRKDILEKILSNLNIMSTYQQSLDIDIQYYKDNNGDMITLQNNSEGIELDALVINDVEDMHDLMYYVKDNNCSCEINFKKQILQLLPDEVYYDINIFINKIYYGDCYNISVIMTVTDDGERNEDHIFNICKLFGAPDTENDESVGNSEDVIIDENFHRNAIGLMNNIYYSIMDKMSLISNGSTEITAVIRQL